MRAKPNQTNFMRPRTDWDTIDLHKDFTHSPIYASFSSTLSSLVARAPLLYHFYPTPFPPAVLGSAPVVEIVTFYNTEEHFVKNVERFIESCAPDMKGCVGHAFGGVVEEIEKAEGEGKGKAVVLCVGWESKEAHMEFRETETFKENVHLLREGMGGAEMVSRAFTLIVDLI